MMFKGLTGETKNSLDYIVSTLFSTFLVT